MTRGWSIGSLADLRARLSELAAERIFARSYGMAADAAYMTDLEDEVGFRENLPADDPSRLVDLWVPIPAPGPHDLLVRIRAASVNPVDTKIRRFSRTQDGELDHRLASMQLDLSCSIAPSS
jgi:hypothetical protein